jgi:hypothetical protein
VGAVRDEHGPADVRLQVVKAFDHLTLHGLTQGRVPPRLLHALDDVFLVTRASAHPVLDVLPRELLMLLDHERAQPLQLLLAMAKHASPFVNAPPRLCHT